MNVPTEETATPARSPLMSVAAWLAALRTNEATMA